MIALTLAAFIAGVLHAAGPDHLAAVAGLSARRHARPWRVGIAWGTGHAFGVTLLGGAALLVGIAVPIHALSTTAESLVGFVLIYLGLRTLAEWKGEAGAGTSGPEHATAHVHTAASDIRGAAGTGLLHGLAGSSHLVGAIPALLLPLPEALAYLLFFGLGAVAGMTMAAASIGLLFRRAPTPGTRGWLRAGAGIAAVFVGAWWAAKGVILAV